MAPPPDSFNKGSCRADRGYGSLLSEGFQRLDLGGGDDYKSD